MQNNKISFEYPKDKIWEFLVIPIGIFLIIFIKLLNIPVFTNHSEHKIELILIGSVIGTLHILASNALTFCYSLQHIIFPFIPILATPKRLKIAGSLLLFICILGAFRT